MIPAAVFFAFAIGLLLEATVMYLLDRRAIRREAAWWEELRADAQLNYGRVFDWEQDQ